MEQSASSSTLNVELLKCKLCQQLPRDVVEVSCCSSLFCWECLMSLPTQKCTVCGADTDIEACQTSKLVQRIIDSISFTCSGCQQSFKTSIELDCHSSQCPVSICVCKYASFGCDAQIQLKDYEAHLKGETNKHLDLLASHIQKQAPQQQPLQQQQQQQQQHCCFRIESLWCCVQKRPFLFSILLALFLFFFVKLGCFFQCIVGIAFFFAFKLWNAHKRERFACGKYRKYEQPQPQHSQKKADKSKNQN